MIPGRLDPVAIARISLVATSTDVYNSDACLSASSTTTIVANSTAPCSFSMTSTSDTTHSPLPLRRQSSTTSSVSAPTLSSFEGELLAFFPFQPSVFPSVGGSHKERTLEQSPAYVPNYNDISTGGAHMPPPPEPTNRSIQSSFEAEYSMRSMDQYYQANFYDYIKNESNVPTIARRLNHVIKDYKLRPVACGLRWLIQDWSTARTVRLLRSIMKEWLPDVAGLLVDLIHDGALNNASDSSPFQENGVAKLTAGLLKGESPAVSAVFMHSLTDNWDLKAVSDLIADVDALLGWNETYFHQFTNSYIACVIHTTSIRSLALDRLHRKTNGGTISNRHSDATIPSTMTGGEWEKSQGSAKNDGQKADEKENEKLRPFRGIGAKAGEEGGSTGSSCELQKGNLDGSEATESSLGKSATLERLTSIYQTNLAVCNYRLALANFKLALLENDIQCDLHRTHALNQAALRHSSLSGSAPNLHFGTRKDKDDSEVRIKNSLPNGDFTSHCESLISLRWAMPPDESSPAVSDRLDLTGSAISIRTLRGLDVASREEHESVPLSRLSGVGQHHAYFGSPSTGRGRRRRASCPGRVCHSFWHVDDEDDDEGMNPVQSISGSATGTERGSRRSSQVSTNAANEVRSIRSEISQTSDQYSARRSSRCSSYARSRRASSIRPPPANFLQPSNRGVGLDLPKATAQDLTIQALNRLSRPAPDLESTKDFQSLSCIHPSPPYVPTFQTCSTPTTFGSTTPSVPGGSAHRTASHYASQYNYQSSRPPGRPSATSRTSFSSSSSSVNFDAYNHLTSPIHFEHPNNHYAYSSTAAYPYATHEEDPRSLFSVPPDRFRSQHPVHVPFNTSSSTSTVEHQEKSLSELNEFFNTNSCPGSMERLEYRREVCVPGDAQRARVASASFRTPARTHIGYST